MEKRKALISPRNQNRKSFLVTPVKFSGQEEYVCEIETHLGNRIRVGSNEKITDVMWMLGLSFSDYC